jgi:hypothetical protein
MATLRNLLDLWPDPKMKETIRSLWREIHDDNVIEGIIQESHGFVLTDALKLDKTTGLWIKTLADSPANAGTEGMVCRIIDANTFDLRHDGFLKIAGINPYQPGVEYYLSPYTEGLLTSEDDQLIGPENSIREYIGIGLEDGFLLKIDRSAQGDKYYRHTQLAPSRVWEVEHNLDKFPSVTISDFDGNQYETEIKHLDRNNTLLTFSETFTGYADLN